MPRPLNLAFLIAALLAGSAVLLQTQALANEKGPVKTTAANADFMLRAHTMNLLQIQLGKLAEQRCQRGSTMALAVKMIVDHEQFDTALSNLADKVALDLPAQIDSAQQVIMNRLKNMPEAQFDSEYINTVIQEQTAAIALFAELDQREKVGDFQTLANETMPVLRDHLKLAQDALTRLASPEGYHNPSNVIRP